MFLFGIEPPPAGAGAGAGAGQTGPGAEGLEELGGPVGGDEVPGEVQGPQVPVRRDQGRLEIPATRSYCEGCCMVLM